MKSGAAPQEVFWQGPTVGWDWGGNAARVFTLCYGLYYPDAIFRRYPGVEGRRTWWAAWRELPGRGRDRAGADPRGRGPAARRERRLPAYSRQRNILPF
jgi:hypothetical protein